MNYIWNRPLRSTLYDAAEAVQHHEMGIIDDKALEYALNDLKEAVVQDSKDLVRYIKQEQVKKHNVLIAQFMNIQDTDIGWYDCKDIMPECVHIQEGGNTFNELLFHKEWNWLMPVVDKCFEVTNQQELLDEVCLGEGLMVDIMHHLQTAYRRGTYDAVVEIIKTNTQTHTL